MDEKAAEESEGKQDIGMKIRYKFLCSEWYKHIIHYLCFLSSPHSLDRTKYRALKIKAQPYVIVEGRLYWKDPAGILLLCLTEEKFTETIKDYHEGLCGGHYSWKVTAPNILQAGFNWPTLFGDTYKFVRSCQKCQLFAEKKRLAPLPLIPVFIEEPFRQWGLDFVGEINPPSSRKHKWVLTATDYFTKWVEAIPTKKANDQIVMKFLEENIFNRFGCPIKIITDNAQVFNSSKFIVFCHNYNVTLSHSTAYHPQGNRFAVSTNKTLMKILKKTIAENQRDWDSKLKFALWAARVSTRRSTGKSPF